MSLLGVLANMAFSSSPPSTITIFLKPIGATFTCLAPFSLGLSMVNLFHIFLLMITQVSLGGIKGDSVKSILALVTVKSIVTPTLTFLAVDQVVSWVEGTSDHLLSNFGLLLGSFPTALGVASYATEFNACVDLVSTTIVLTTLASAPIMYSIANILTALHKSPDALARCSEILDIDFKY